MLTFILRFVTSWAQHGSCTSRHHALIPGWRKEGRQKTFFQWGISGPPWQTSHIRWDHLLIPRLIIGGGVAITLPALNQPWFIFSGGWGSRGLLSLRTRALHPCLLSGKKLGDGSWTTSATPLFWGPFAKLWWPGVSEFEGRCGKGCLLMQVFLMSRRRSYALSDIPFHFGILRALPWPLNYNSRFGNFSKLAFPEETIWFLWLCLNGSSLTSWTDPVCLNEHHSVSWGFRTRTVLHSFLLTGSDKAFACIEKHWESVSPARITRLHLPAGSGCCGFHSRGKTMQCFQLRNLGILIFHPYWRVLGQNSLPEF